MLKYSRLLERINYSEHLVSCTGATNRKEVVVWQMMYGKQLVLFQLTN